MVFDYRGRQKRVTAAAQADGLDALLVTHLPNVRYLCGFTGSSALLALGGGKPVLFTDGRYITQAKQEAATARIVIAKGALVEAAAQWASGQRGRSRGAWRLGIESDHVTVTWRGDLRKALPPGIQLRDSRGQVERARMVKDEDELQAIRRAVTVGASLLEAALKTIRPGVKETEVAAEIEYAARRAGAEGMAFDTIVGAGGRSALPHGRATQHAIPARGFVVLDFGVILGGYCSDMTRTVHVGHAPGESRRLYQAVREAQEAATEAVREGIAAGTVDEAARSSLRRAGYGKYFTHSTGHGVGLEIHEAPRVARAQAEALRAGMVITIEPGAYVGGQGGVRIEDMVAVTATGCEVLTPAPKELIEL